MSIDKLKTKFTTGAWLTDVKHYFKKINEIIDYINTNFLDYLNNLSILGKNRNFINPPTIEAYGDSITVGSNASISSNSYVNLLNTLYNKTLVNRAESGKGIWKAIYNHYANIDVTSKVFTIIMAGFNDVRRGGSSVKTNSKIINGYKAIISNQFLDSYTPGSTVSSNITRTGTWLTYSGGINVGAKTNLGAYTITYNDSIEYTFNNSNVVLGLIGGDGVTQIHADFEILIDGISQGIFTENNQTDGISDGVYDNARSAMCILFKNLSDEPHTIKLVNKTSNTLIVDYFGHLKEAKFCNPILIMHAPKMNSAGYATSPNLASDIIINNLNLDITNIVNYFPENYPIFIGETNTYYDISDGLDSDHIHPNDVGHDQIFKAAKNALTGLPYLGNSISILNMNNTFTGKNIFNELMTLHKGFLVQGSFNPQPTGEGLELEYVSPDSIITSYDRTNSAWLGLMIRALSFDFKVSNTSTFKIDSNGLYSILPTYADEAAAVSGGLPSNQLYKTLTGEIRIKL